MASIEDNELAIQKLDTTRMLRPVPRELVNAIAEIQLKLNEVIELINVLSLPDDEEAMDDEDDGEDVDVKTIGKPVPKPSKK